MILKITNNIITSQPPHLLNIFRIAKVATTGYDIVAAGLTGLLLFRTETDAALMFPLLKRLGWIAPEDDLIVEQYSASCRVVDRTEAIMPLIEQLLKDHRL